MVFLFGKKLQFGAFVCLALQTLLASQDNTQVTAWVNPIVTKGNKFFDSKTGLEFRMKGMAYHPRANAGELSEITGYDFVTDEHEDIWKPHIQLMKDLGVNTVRLYSVDPSKSHDKFMCACSEAGIYVLVGMSAPCLGCHISVEKAPPACYSKEMAIRSQMIYNAFAVYDNLLGFSVGNEVNLPDGTTVPAPCVKALIRDVKNYADSCAGYMRRIPIGIDLADVEPRKPWFEYYDCSIDDNEYTRADWIGFNPYVECDPATNLEYSDSKGLQRLMKEYKATGYARPVMFGEYGCNLGENTIEGFENQRSFLDAKWMNEEPEMTAQVVGGCVFEFSTELANTVSKSLGPEKDPGKYGVGYFDPIDCDHDKTPCKYVPYPEYKNLKKAYTTTKASTLKKDAYKPQSDAILDCPAQNFSSKLPPVPKIESLSCSVRQPKCNGKLANAFKKESGNKKVTLGEKKSPTNKEQSDDPSSGSSTNMKAASVVASVVSIAFAVAFAAF